MSEPVIITRTLPATIDRVFSAWTNPKLIQQWFATGPSLVESAELDLRPGGPYKFCIRDAEGTNVVFGRYERIEVPTLLEFTWQWEESSFEKGISLVTVHLEDSGAVTKMTLIHARLANQKSEDMHTAGWDSLFNRLVSYLSI